MKNLIRNVLLCAVMLSLLYAFSGCSAQRLDAPREESTEAETANRETTAPDGISFRYFYRGFTPVPFDDRASIEAFQEIGIKLVLDEDSWYDYMGKFCPGIPYYEEVDYSRECLLTSVIMGAKPTYSIANDILSLKVENGYFAPEYDDDPSSWIYALNGEETAHFYVEVLIISREDLPTDIEGMVYHP